MLTDDFNPKKALQITRMIHLLLIVGSLAYVMLIFHIARDRFILNLDLSDPLFLSLIILCCIAIPAGYFFSKRTSKKIDPEDSLRKKYSIYTNGLIIKSATCEVVALFAAVCLLLTYNLSDIIFFFIALTAMGIYYPTPLKIGREINMTRSEIELFY